MSVTETLVPSVEGRTRSAVIAAFTAATTSSGALAGAMASIIVAVMVAGAGAVGAPAPDPRWTVVGLVTAGLVLDGLVLASGRPRPVTYGRQVRPTGAGSFRPRWWPRSTGPVSVSDR